MAPLRWLKRKRKMGSKRRRWKGWTYGRGSEKALREKDRVVS